MIGLASYTVLVSSTGELSSQEATEEPYQCQVYMAPSTIPGSGFGLFIVRDVKEGGKILPYSDAPSIILCGMENIMYQDEWNNGDYLWGGQAFSSSECEGSQESVVTFGSLSNYHTYLMNVSPDPEKYDDTLANRYIDPGAGAFSYYEGNSFYATRDISAGEEIFAGEWYICLYHHVLLLYFLLFC